MKYKAKFFDAEGRMMGEAMVSTFYFAGVDQHPGSHLFYCAKCGKVWARIEVEGGDWRAYEHDCKTCGRIRPNSHGDLWELPGVSYVAHWSDSPDELDFYPAYILIELFLFQFQLYEEGR